MKLAAIAQSGFPAIGADGLGAGQLAPIAVGISLGLGAAIPIGPVNVELARRVLQGGLRAGVALGLGAVSVDVFYCLITAMSFIHVFNRPSILIPVAACGACLLAFLGVQCLRAARLAWRTDPLAAAEVADLEGGVGCAAVPGRPESGAAGDGRASHARSAYLTGLLMTLLNPITLAFWFSGALAAGGTVSAATPSSGGGQFPKATADDLPMVCIGVFLGTTAWVFAFSGLLAWAARRAGNRPDRRRKWLAAADVAGGATLLVFAALAFLRLFRSIS